MFSHFENLARFLDWKEPLMHEMLAVVGDLEDSKSSAFPYWGLAILASFIRSYLSVEEFRLVLQQKSALMQQLLNVLKVALELSRDDKTTHHVTPCFDEVCNTIEDAKAYIWMINRSFFSLSEDKTAIFKRFQAIVEQDFTFLRLLPDSTSCGFDLRFYGKSLCGKPEVIDKKYVKKADVLGAGAYSVVYKGEWCGKDVAVKEIKGSEHFDWSEPWIKRELEVHEKLQAEDCSHIVRLLGYFESEKGNKNLVLELMATDLKNFIRESYPIPILKSIDIMIKISKGMQHLHRNGVIHRDLKPSNILVTPKLHNLSVKIADFGTSKANFMTANTSTLDRGSLNYMAPEMISMDNDDAGYYTRSIDVYSFAITCSEILTGNLPFLRPIVGKKEEFKTLLKEGHRPDLPTNMPTRLRELIRLCWSENPAYRPNFEWITNQLWVVKEDVLTGTGLSQRFQRLLQGCRDKDGPTFEHICEQLFIDKKDVLTHSGLSGDVLNHLRLLFQDGDAISLHALCRQLGAAKKDVNHVFLQIDGDVPGFESMEGWNSYMKVITNSFHEKFRIDSLNATAFPCRSASPVLGKMERGQTSVQSLWGNPRQNTNLNPDEPGNLLISHNKMLNHHNEEEEEDKRWRLEGLKGDGEEEE